MSETNNLAKYSLAWYEYIVFGLVLVASLGIGIFYGFFGSKNKTNDEFLRAGRSMGIFPVTLSLLCSFVSAITLLGAPVEMYFYGSSCALLFVSFIPMTLAMAYIYVPVYFDLQLTTAYEYFKWRFSPLVQILLTIFSSGQLMIYMATVVWGPSLALDQVAGINPTLSAAAIFLVCIAYSSMGGLKAVLWTDALQAIVMILALTAVSALGVYEIGGFATIWETSTVGERTSFVNFDFDPRTRYTMFSTIIGGYFTWLPLFTATQAQIQRYNSVPTLRQSRQCLLFNCFGLVTIRLLSSFIGLMIFTYYFTCDPVRSKRVTSPDQLLPLFVIEALGKYTGLPGLLVAGLTCASLSTVSSGLNSMAAMIVEDFFRWFRPGLTETQLGLASKLVSIVTGLIAFGLVFVVAAINDTVQIQPFASMSIGCLYGPILGAFTLGMIFPWANNVGTIIGVLVSILITGTIGVGSILAGLEGLIFSQTLSLSTDECDPKTNDTTTTNEYSLGSNTVRLIGWNTGWKTQSSDFIRDVWNISYMWQPAIAVLTTILVSLLISFSMILFQGRRPRRVNHSLLSKPFLKFWVWIFGQKYMNEWVDYDSPSFANRHKRNKPTEE